MIPFWRQQPLTPAEDILFNLLVQAHARCAERENSSSVAVSNSASNTGNYNLSLIAALSAIGGKHAPVKEAVIFLQRCLLNPQEEVDKVLDTCARIPGWGNSFYKDHPDPAFEEVNLHLQHHWPLLSDTIQRVTGLLHDQDLKLYPNAAAYTAATALALRIPPELSPWLVVRARLDPWAAIFLRNVA